MEQSLLSTNHHILWAIGPNRCQTCHKSVENTNVKCVGNIDIRNTNVKCFGNIDIRLAHDHPSRYAISWVYSQSHHELHAQISFSQ